MCPWSGRWRYLRRARGEVGLPEEEKDGPRGATTWGCPAPATHVPLQGPPRSPMSSGEEAEVGVPHGFLRISLFSLNLSP